MDKLIWIILTLIAGCFLPLQGSMNSRLAKAGENPVYASMISFTVGVIALIIYIFLTSQNISWKGLKEAPTYSWLGGILGAFYVTVIVLAFPKIGPGLTFGLVVAGQLLTSYNYGTFPNYGYTTSADKYRKNSRNGNDCGRSSHYEKILNQK